MKTICPYRDWHWTLATDSENPFSLNHLANGMIKRRRYLPVTFPLPDIRLKRKCQILPINKHAGLPKIERGQTVAKHGICKSQHIPLYVRSATTLAWPRWRPFALGQCNRWVVLHIENSVLKILYRFTIYNNKYMDVSTLVRATYLATTMCYYKGQVLKQSPTAHKQLWRGKRSSLRDDVQ